MSSLLLGLFPFCLPGRGSSCPALWIVPDEFGTGGAIGVAAVGAGRMDAGTAGGGAAKEGVPEEGVSAAES